MINQDDKLDLLRTLLLTDDRQLTESISNKISILEETIREREKLSVKVTPIIKEELEKYTLSIPKTLGPVITKTLKVQIEESKDEVVEALYPILGKMIKKYISNEIKMLSESIDKSTKEAFSSKGIKRKFMALFSGVKENDMIISALAKAHVEQIFVIEKGSGILLGSYQTKETVDEDMISGMLTAIKAFVEDAFKETQHDLQSIEYDLYEIHLHSFHKYYIASAVSGTFTERLENELENFNFEISEDISKKSILHDRAALEALLLDRFKTYKFTEE
ncbi:cell envelope biogenesis protein OmpA [Nonlabens sp.]|uniref:cell envelope biogenesis protein OmpA n=1 Tax=Nonlabens sp. TaxID=1888209 RepID=UPI00326501C7